MKFTCPHCPEPWGSLLPHVLPLNAAESLAGASEKLSFNFQIERPVTASWRPITRLRNVQAGNRDWTTKRHLNWASWPSLPFSTWDC